eukprot:CAMPEP_0181328084 /NCGR_PEP_ID=MMETSP1101-20121128/22492_1 /TAXON_ID=46948 /ORGANISM="Rhodomonas abbreviata, Strain Caron Lab Isolate" /LENGTH=210 /DNA_ID=CAMNT_0023436879 /DNA_START=71 /DNA_END=703 /DNA_ORIENTATION=-
MIGARSLRLVARSTTQRAVTAALSRSGASRVFPVKARSFFSAPALRDIDADGKFIPTEDTLADLEGRIPDRIKKLGQEIVKLNMIETKELMEYLKNELGLDDMMGGGMMGGGMPMGGQAAPAAAAGGAPEAAAAAPAAEKTSFTLKLDSFNASDKLKVIKEVRAVTGLGLKESKEIVEGAPKVLKDGISKEDAEKFKKQIEAVGGKITIE